MPRGDIPGCLERLCALLPAPSPAADEAQQGLVSGQKSGLEDWRRLQVYGKRLRLMVVAIMLCGYLSFVVLCWGPRLQDGEKTAVAVVVLFQIPAASMASAFYLTVSTDPGAVPHGFRQHGTRTCSVCHVQKPERCHHCSVCGRCVLNMDHHCIYVNACIGFHNRKFFCQLLFHSLCCMLLIVVFAGPELVRRVLDAARDAEVSRSPAFWLSTAFIFVVWAGLAALAIPFGRFTWYHFGAVVRNSTTIEDLKLGGERQSPYDMGWGQNLMQVFGGQFLLWLLPVRSRWLEPLGDGVRWRKNTGQVRPRASSSA